MQLDDSKPCGGMTNFGALLGLCVSCERRTRTVAAPMLPPAQQNEDGEWWCAERRFGGHPRRLVPVALDASPAAMGAEVVSVIRLVNAR